MILAIGYRIRSARGAQFKKFASTILKEYLIEGAALDTEKLTNNLDYFKKLQKRIRDIRSRLWATFVTDSSVLKYEAINTSSSVVR